jgi:hypothetical protein
MAIVFVGIDLTKNVFALHGVDEQGRARSQELDTLESVAQQRTSAAGCF